MRNVILLVVALLMAVLFVAPASVAADVEAAVALVEELEAITQAMDWETYATYVHPDALIEFRESMAPVVDAMVGLLEADTTELASLQAMYPGIDDLLKRAQGAPPDQFFGASMNLIFSLVPGSEEMFASLDSDVIGGLPENDSLVHVVTRSKLQAGPMTIEDQMDVITCKVYDGGYKILLSAEFKGLAEGLKQGMGM